MTNKEGKSLAEVQTAADFLAEVPADERESAFELLAESILNHFGRTHDSSVGTERLFSQELPLNIQRFVAAWLLRIITKEASALDFGNTRAQTATLFDRTFEAVYQHCGITKRTQTYEKINALADHARSLLADLASWVEASPDLSQVNSLQTKILRTLSLPASQPLLSQLLPAEVSDKNHLYSLFRVVTDYATANDADGLRSPDAVCAASDEYEREVESYGGEDVSRILGGLVRHLKTSVTNHFHATEIGKPPRISFLPISKKYPLQRVGATIAIKIRILNDGTGPARDLQLDKVTSGPCLTIKTSPTLIGTIRPGDSFVFDILAEVSEGSEQSTLQVELSSARLGERIEHPLELTVDSQRENVDWESVETKEPYSLEAVSSDAELVGRRSELLQLMRLITVPTVGSGFIYGQKRVGKTSLANVVKNRLQSMSNEDWVVIYKGSGNTLPMMPPVH